MSVSENIFNKYLGRGLTREMLGRVEQLAYERGHSAGQSEVDMIFMDLMHDLFGILSVEKRQANFGKSLWTVSMGFIEPVEPTCDNDWQVIQFNVTEQKTFEDEADAMAFYKIQNKDFYGFIRVAKDDINLPELSIFNTNPKGR